MESLDAIKKEYTSLLEGGVLSNLNYNFKGSWEKDKNLFIRYYEDNLKVLNDVTIDDEDEQPYFDGEDSY